MERILNRDKNIDMHNLYDLDMERAVLSSVLYSDDNLISLSQVIFI